MKTVLVTGAAGDVGTHLRRELAGRYKLRLSDVKPMTSLAPGEEFMRADIASMEDLAHVTRGVDAIVHLGGFSVEGPWEAILPANIIGAYNVFESARVNGVKRILFATSNHAVGFYRRDETIDHRVYPRPDSRYGVSKVFGEALGSLYADKYGMEIFNMRLGNVNPRPVDKRRLSIWISPRDLAQLVAIGIEHPGIRFEVVYGVSGNRRSWYDNSNAERLGYRPQDDSEGFAEEVLAAEKPGADPRAERFQGGAFVLAEVGGDPNKPVPATPAKKWKTPKLAAPPGAIDTHMHIYDTRVPAGPQGVERGAPVAPPLPGHFPVSAYREVQRQLGISRTVIVQPNAYVDDNRVTLAAIAEIGEGARGVAVVKPGVTDAELERLTRGGIRAIRFMTLPGGALGWDVMDELAARVQPFGWHSIVQLDGRTLPERAAQIRRLPGRFIVDHVGKFLEPVAPTHEAFRTLLGLLDTGRCWVKLSAPYEVSKTGGPRYEDVGALAKALVRAAPERMLWASNWPHPSVPKEQRPDDADLLDLLLEWAPDDATRRKILADNPAALYG